VLEGQLSVERLVQLPYHSLLPGAVADDHVVVKYVVSGVHLWLEAGSENVGGPQDLSHPCPVKTDQEG
jgi:hypothetical protein